MNAEIELRDAADTHRINLEALQGIVAHCVGHDAASLRGHIEATLSIEITAEHYGMHTLAAAITKDDALRALRKMLEAQNELELHRAELRVKWQKRLDEFRKSTSLDDEALTPEDGPKLLRACQSLESSIVTKELYGDLMDEAEAVRKQAIAGYKAALTKVAWMIIDPASVPDVISVPVEVLEPVLAHFKAMPLDPEIFGAENIERAREMHAQSVAKQEALLAKMKSAGQTIDGAIEAARAREQAAAEERQRAEATRSPEEAKAREARLLLAAKDCFKVVQRLTEACQLDDKNHVGTINSDVLLELVQASQGLVARVEGRLQ